MKSNFEHYVEKILKQTACGNEEKEDISEELMTHLELLKEELMREGMNEKEAELEAMERFGPEKEIGCQLQQSIFPYRKELMLTLSVSSFIFSISVYLLLLSIEGDALIGWLIPSMFINSLLFLIALNQVVGFNRRRWMNSILITHIIIDLYGYTIVSSFDHTAFLPIAILNWLIILLALFLVYQTTIYEMNLQGEIVKEAKRLHLINLVLGAVVAGVALFYLWVGMWLFGGYHPLILLMMIPFVLWILLYFLQMKLLKKHKGSAFVIAIISILINALILIYIFFPF
ncbi:hypothetical protein DCC39_14080 [Pueribacillus theae]|uniref:Uncharacterized protein n=1 Tax=Pueribacillus theae TaxID=2171751 RepID=A0A2U1JUL0_9BACI|nr:permease prefix domain 1-containing protein [Pueribacillus theae]PWA08886.1 hypothetical protein DCC39_14080 [Pueribacillus theae]